MRCIDTKFSPSNLAQGVVTVCLEDGARIVWLQDLMHLSICINLNTPSPPPRATPRTFDFFDFWRSNSRPPVPRSCSNAPHVRPAGWANAPPPRHFFYRLTGQDHFKTICYKYQLVFFKRNFVRTFKTVPEFLRPIFGQPSGHECNILSAKSLNIFSSLVVYERSNSPISTAWCQIPHPRSGSKVKFPTPREREGVKCPWYARGGWGDVEVTNW